MAAVLGYLFIFIARVADVSMATVRIIMVVRGRRLLGAIIGFFEVTIFLTALARVLGDLSDPLNILAYALGFATGNYVGGWVEERLALGFATVEIIPNPAVADGLITRLREAGFGVTVMEGEGREGRRKVLLVGTGRKALPALTGLVCSADPRAFITVLDTRHARGGFYHTRKGK